MNVIIIGDNYTYLSDGEPDYYVEDCHFYDILTNPSLASAIYKQLGITCVGRLGKPDTDGIFREKDISNITFDSFSSKEGLCFYEKI